VQKRPFLRKNAYEKNSFVNVSFKKGSLLAAKGRGVHPLKRLVSWVENVVRQFVQYLLEVLSV